MFRNDPQFRDFFRNRRQRETPRTQGMGSGFVIDADGVILTNNHVVADADQGKVKFHDGRELFATEVKTDPRAAVAVLRVIVEGRKLTEEQASLFLRRVGRELGEVQDRLDSVLAQLVERYFKTL